MPLPDPRGLGFDASSREAFTATHDHLLLLNNLTDHVFRHLDAVRVAEDFDPPPTVRWARIPKPAHAVRIVTKRRDVLQCIEQVRRRWSRTGMIPIDRPALPSAKPPVQTLSLDPAQHFGVRLDCQQPGCWEANALEVAEQRMRGRRPRSHRPTYRHAESLYPACLLAHFLPIITSVLGAW